MRADGTNHAREGEVNAFASECRFFGTRLDGKAFSFCSCFNLATQSIQLLSNDAL